MKLSLKNTTVLASVIAVSSTMAMADTVSFVEIIETNGFGSNSATDTATNGTATITGGASTVATQNADGTSEVEAATNGFGESKVTSTAQFEQSETNTTGMDRDYTLSYNLTGQTAEFNLGFTVATATAFGLAVAPVAATAPTNPDNPFGNGADELPANFTQFSGASFEYNIEVNGDLIFNARADALINGFSPFGGPVIDVESNFVASTASSLNGFTFSVDAISDDIFLGTFADGEDIEVISYLTARAYTPGGAFDGFAIGVNSFSSDPINLSSIGSLSSVPTSVVVNPSPVPLPAAGFLLIAGLGGLAATRRRKS